MSELGLSSAIYQMTLEQFRDITDRSFDYFKLGAFSAERAARRRGAPRRRARGRARRLSRSLADEAHAPPPPSFCSPLPSARQGANVLRGDQLLKKTSEQARREAALSADERARAVMVAGYPEASRTGRHTLAYARDARVLTRTSF